MAIFDADGNRIRTCYDADGGYSYFAYDKDGNLLNICDELLVMNYNVGRWDGLNAQSNIVPKIYDFYLPDIVGHQEWTTRQQSYIEGIGYYVTASPIPEDAQTSRLAIDTKLPLTDITYGEYIAQGQNEHRDWLKGYITYQGKTICVVTTHMSLSGNSRAAEALELLALVANEEYFIILADMNTVCMSVNDADYINTVKPFVDAGYHLANCTAQSGFYNTWFETASLDGTAEPNDNIITSANIAIDFHYVDRIKVDNNTIPMPLDHLPLVVGVQVS